MPKVRAFRVAVVVSAPLGTGEAPREVHEIQRTIGACRTSGAKIEVQCLVPATVSLLRSLACDLLLIASHAQEDFLLLEDQLGLPSPVGADAVADALRVARPAAVLFNGCETAEFARRVHAQVPAVSMIGHSGFLTNASAALFAAEFVGSVAVSRSAAEAFGAASQTVADALGDDGFALLEGSLELPRLSPGRTIARGVDGAVRRLRSSNVLRSREALVRAAVEGCLGGGGEAISIFGPPGAGVSRLLETVRSRVEPAFDVVVWTAGPVVQDAVPELGKTELRTLVCIDDADRLAPSQLRAFVAAHRASFGAVRLLMGGHRELGLGGVDDMPIPPMLAAEVPSAVGGRLDSDRLSVLMASLDANSLVVPATIERAIRRVRAGVTADGLRTWFRAGELDEDWCSLLRPLASTAVNRLLLRAVALAGSPVRRDALESAVRFAASQVGAPNAERDIDAFFVQLEFRGLVFEWRASADGSRYVSSSAWLHRAVEHNARAAPHQERRDLLRGFLNYLLGCDVDPADAEWVARVLTAAEAAGLDDQTLAVGRNLIGPVSEFRRATRAEPLFAIASSTLEVAERIGEWDVAAQAALVCGEGRYSSGDWAAAITYFRRCLRASASAGSEGDRLRAHRAIGQVHYRQGDFLSALAEYELAEDHALGADPSFVATLQHQHGKALFRLGRLEEAEARLRSAFEYRRGAKDLQALVRVQQDLGRVLVARGDVGRGREMISAALVTAEAAQMRRFLPAPLYELFQISFRLGEGDAATLAARCRAAADDLQDEMWIALAAVAEGMVAFRAQDYRGAGRLFRSALEVGARRGFDVVRDDVQRFVVGAGAGSPVGVAPDLDERAALVAETWGLTIAKARKAIEYARGPSRIVSADIGFESKHGSRRLRWVGHSWSCDCTLFADSGSCTHSVAMMLMEANPFGPSPRAAGPG